TERQGPPPDARLSCVAATGSRTPRLEPGEATGEATGGGVWPVVAEADELSAVAAVDVVVGTTVVVCTTVMGGAAVVVSAAVVVVCVTVVPSGSGVAAAPTADRSSPRPTISARHPPMRLIVLRPQTASGERGFRFRGCRGTASATAGRNSFSIDALLVSQ